jgi:hypothetical protein
LSQWIPVYNEYIPIKNKKKVNINPNFNINGKFILMSILY